MLNRYNFKCTFDIYKESHLQIKVLNANPYIITHNSCRTTSIKQLVQVVRCRTFIYIVYPSNVCRYLHIIASITTTTTYMQIARSHRSCTQFASAYKTIRKERWNCAPRCTKRASIHIYIYIANYRIDISLCTQY